MFLRAIPRLAVMSTIIQILEITTVQESDILSHTDIMGNGAFHRFPDELNRQNMHDACDSCCLFIALHPKLIHLQ